MCCQWVMEGSLCSFIHSKAVCGGSGAVLFLANDHSHCQHSVEDSQLYLLFPSAGIRIISCSSWQQTGWDGGKSGRENPRECGAVVGRGILLWILSHMGFLLPWRGVSALTGQIRFPEYSQLEGITRVSKSNSY